MNAPASIDSYNPLLVISGPTATGKTALALHLAKLLPADLISADSRQVYTNLNLIPGKDIPPGFSKQTSPLVFHHSPIPVYTNNHLSIYGYDLVAPDQPWNVSFFCQFAWKIITHLWHQRRLPIVVGGTGLYIKSLTSPFLHINTPPNPKLRTKLEKLSPSQLQSRLLRLNPNKFHSLNHSDRHNPRRLIRAIEIALTSPPPSFSLPSASTLKLALTAPPSEIRTRITQRVKTRLRQDYSSELLLLKKLSPDFCLPAASALGYQILHDFHSNKITRHQALTLWSTREFNYAKRQLTWLRAQPDFHWIDITAKDYYPKVVDLITRWYSEFNHDRHP